MRPWVVLLLLTLMSGTAVAGSWRVEQDGSGQFTVIQDAVDVAASGDTILIGPGFYQEQGTHPALNGWTACAFWDDSRDLTFIGADAEVVTIGLNSYSEGVPNAGIGVNQDVVLRVENISFRNLREAIGSQYGEVYVQGCRFEAGHWGIGTHDLLRCEIGHCSFQEYDYAIASFRCEYIELTACGFDNAYIDLTAAVEGVVRDCTVTSGGFIQYYLSSGRVENCTVNCSGNIPCISVSDSDTVRFYDNSIDGGSVNMIATGRSTHVYADRNRFGSPQNLNFDLAYGATLEAHTNEIFPAPGVIPYFVTTFYYDDTIFVGTVDMGGNYWGSPTSEYQLGLRILDGNDDPDLKVFVNVLPIMMEPVPAEKSSLGGVKALFR